MLTGIDMRHIIFKIWGRVYWHKTYELWIWRDPACHCEGQSPEAISPGKVFRLKMSLKVYYKAKNKLDY